MGLGCAVWIRIRNTCGIYGMYLQMCTPCAAVHMDGWMDGWINVMNMNISDGGKFIDIP